MTQNSVEHRTTVVLNQSRLKYNKNLRQEGGVTILIIDDDAKSVNEGGIFGLVNYKN